MNKKKIRQRLPSPKVYNAFIKTLELKNLFLKEAQINYISEAIKLPVNVKESSEAKYINIPPNLITPNLIRVYHTYKVRIRGKDSSKDDIVIRCTFVVIYEAQRKMTDSLFNAFKIFNLRLNTWPYLREFIHNTLGRMNIPSIIAPIFKPLS